MTDFIMEFPILKPREKFSLCREREFFFACHQVNISTFNKLADTVNINCFDGKALRVIIENSCGPNSLIIFRKLLLNPNIDPNLSDITGTTALHTAMRLDHHSAVTHLLSHPGLDVDLKNVDGDTPAMVAINYCSVDSLELLLGDVRVKIDDDFVMSWGVVIADVVEQRWDDVGKVQEKIRNMIRSARCRSRTNIIPVIQSTPHWYHQNLQNYFKYPSYPTNNFYQQPHITSFTPIQPSPPGCEDEATPKKVHRTNLLALPRPQPPPPGCEDEVTTKKVLPTNLLTTLLPQPPPPGFEDEAALRKFLSTYLLVPPPPPPPEPGVSKFPPSPPDSGLSTPTISSKLSWLAAKAKPVYKNDWDQEFPKELMDMCVVSRCGLCKVDITSLNVATSHYEGKPHKKKVREFCFKVGTLKTEYNPEGEGKVIVEALKSVTKEDLTCSAITAPADVAEMHDKEGNKFHCDVCNIYVNSRDMLVSHTQRKNHKKNLNQRVKLKCGEEIESRSLLCEVCNYKFTSQELLDNHIQGKIHKKNSGQGAGSNELNMKELKIPSLIDIHVSSPLKRPSSPSLIDIQVSHPLKRLSFGVSKSTAFVGVSPSKKSDKGVKSGKPCGMEFVESIEKKVSVLVESHKKKMENIEKKNEIKENNTEKKQVKRQEHYQDIGRGRGRAMSMLGMRGMGGFPGMGMMHNAQVWNGNVGRGRWQANAMGMMNPGFDGYGRLGRGGYRPWINRDGRGNYGRGRGKSRYMYGCLY